MSLLLTERFWNYVSSVIDEDGVHPFPAMALKPSGRMEVAAIIEGPTALKWFWDQVANEGATECIFGLDRTTKPGQGTEFSDVLTCAHWSEGMDGKKWDSSFRIGVIDYQDEPRIVRPWNWDNDYWREKMTEELKSCRPLMRVTVSTDK